MWGMCEFILWIKLLTALKSIWVPNCYLLENSVHSVQKWKIVKNLLPRIVDDVEIGVSFYFFLLPNGQVFCYVKMTICTLLFHLLCNTTEHLLYFTVFNFPDSQLEVSLSLQELSWIFFFMILEIVKKRI